MFAPVGQWSVLRSLKPAMAGSIPPRRTDGAALPAPHPLRADRRRLPYSNGPKVANSGDRASECRTSLVDGRCVPAAGAQAPVRVSSTSIPCPYATVPRTGHSATNAADEGSSPSGGTTCTAPSGTGWASKTQARGSIPRRCANAKHAIIAATSGEDARLITAARKVRSLPLLRRCSSAVEQLYRLSYTLPVPSGAGPERDGYRLGTSWTSVRIRPPARIVSCLPRCSSVAERAVGDREAVGAIPATWTLAVPRGVAQ